MTDWMTPARVAEYAGRHVVTVLKALKGAELHGHQRKHRGRWQVHPDAVDAWICGTDGVEACGCAKLRYQRRAGTPKRP